MMNVVARVVSDTCYDCGCKTIVQKTVCCDLDIPAVEEQFLNAPKVSVTEALGSPVRRRVSVTGRVMNVSNTYSVVHLKYISDNCFVTIHHESISAFCSYVVLITDIIMILVCYHMLSTGITYSV